MIVIILEYYLPNGGYDHETGKDYVDCNSVWVDGNPAGLGTTWTWWTWVRTRRPAHQLRFLRWRAVLARILRPISLLRPLLQPLLLSAGSSGACGTYDLYPTGANRSGTRTSGSCGILVLLRRIENLLSVCEAVSRWLAAGGPAAWSSTVS